MSTSVPDATAVGGLDLEAAYRAARPRLIRVAVLLVGDLPTAEDLVQDVFVGLQRRSHAQVDSLDSYLTAAVLNAARSRLRRRRIAAAGLLRYAQVRHGGQVDIAELSVEQQRVWRAIDRLPVRQRQVVVFRYYRDLSEREIARVLGGSTGTVKTCTARAMNTLAAALGDDDA